ncbi:MAG: TIGR03619 family F420-dependent LLM class oxidoreductase [Alphaproteobacteria bacterium]|nr:MAG: TIGR03619 family F420-dependent LLM class oxidoreductase [Alphaproteobacteria bacterium]
MALPLEAGLSIGIQNIHRRTEPAAAPWQPAIDEMQALVRLVDDCGYDSLWVGDHIAFAAAIFDPLLQLAQAAVVSRRLKLGTNVYLVPLRHPVLVAKQAATLDHLSEGRLIFGVGIGGEFPKEFEACGVPLGERGARLTAAIPLLRQLWSGEPVSYGGRYFGAFSEVSMQPPSRQPGRPPIWVGGRADAALARAGSLADGWISYVVTPETYRAGLEKIAAAAESAGRKIEHFGTGHLLFARLDETYDKALDAAAATLSNRYAMDFRRAAERYAALGRPEQVAARIRAFHEAGVRHLVLDLVGPYEERPQQIDGFARDVLPLLADLR